MTEHAVVNLHGAVNGEDEQKVKVGGDCNGVSHAKSENGDVGGKIESDVTGELVGGSDAVDADGDSGEPDLVAVIDGNGDGGAEAEGLKVGDGESHVTGLKVAESEAEAKCETVSVNNKENDCLDASAVSNGTSEEEIRVKGISNGTVSVDADVAGENADLGSVTDDMGVADISVVEVGVKDLSKIHDHDHQIEAGAEEVQNGEVDRELSELAVKNVIHGDAKNVIHGDANGVNTIVMDSNDVVDVQGSVEDEIHGDSNGVTTVTEVNGPVDVLNGVEDDIHGDANGVAIIDANGEIGIHSSVENEIHGDSNEDTLTDANDEVGVYSSVENHGNSNGDTVADANEVGIHSSVENEIHGDSNGDTVADSNEVGVHSSVENKIHGDSNGDTVADANAGADVHSSVENEIHGDSNGDTIADANGEVGVQDSVENEIHDDVNVVDVSDAVEILGDEKDGVTVLEGLEDENRGNGESESAAVESGLTVESAVPVVDGVSASDVEECTDGGDKASSGEKAQIESVDSRGGDEKNSGTVVQERSVSVSHTDLDKTPECENIVSTDVSYEKDIVTNESQAGESESLVVTDVQNGLKDTNLSECSEKNPVSVVGVSATRDVKECANEFDQNGLEKPQIEAVTDVDVEKSVVGVDVQNSLADPELGECTMKEIPVEVEVGSKPESSEETIHDLVLEGEKVSALNSSDKTADDNVVSKVNDNEVESEAEPSADISDIKNIASESKAESSNNAVESEGEPFINMSDKKNNVVKSETGPSVQGEISVEGEVGNCEEGNTRPAQEGSAAADSFDGQNVGSEVVKRPFYYLIRLPRYDDDENIQEQINNALKQVEEKTELRGKIRAEINSRKDICNECLQEFRAAKSAERTARDLLKSKRQEMESVKSTMNRLNNAISVGDIDNKIRNMEHRIQHETLPLNEEKQLIRQIKQLKQSRGELSSIIGKQDQLQKSTDQNDNIEEHIKHSELLKKEFDLLKNNLQKAETTTDAAKKKYDDEWDKLSELQGHFNVADKIRQDGYTKLRALKSQLHEKKKYFWEYKGAVAKGQELAAEGKKEELQCFCIDQVERIMELWNKSDEFRKDYIRCNTRSILRRLQTLDGRALGPDEQPPVIPNAFNTDRASKSNYQIMQSTPEQEKKSTLTESLDKKDESVPKVVAQKTEKNQKSKAKKPAKPAPLEKSLVAVPRWGDEPEDTIEEPVRTKEEEELILKAEKARKEEEAEKLKEKRRQEEIEKAKEAMERKKRNAEKAQQRAAAKAQKEAEQKEKEREKRARKKEKRKAAATENTENTEQEPSPTSEILTRSTEEIDQSEKPAEVTKRPKKPSQFTKQTKSKSIPLPLRNRGKRRIQPWMWWALIAVLIVVALFYIGNTISLRSWLQGSGF
ncbi:hypothetical protein Lal_00017320 [Lupinus albus]|uniref:Uncharacterized protein n=1 Tax=Lupinus albus TaxID=3870 RepID=A0A6A4QR99_LUPAL|nr:hypothetical protein Lalb_Chr04g0258871 [Lupinus albus]KAF1869744.1 hypothetical protein Lal_00017320 [Lupinus albus]